MNNKDRERRLTHLMGKVHFPLHGLTNHRQLVTEQLKKPRKDIWNYNDLIECAELYKLAEELVMPENELYFLWSKTWRNQQRSKYYHLGTPPRESRDNKDVFVGGGGSNRNKIRYPSKKRSIKTWKKFYKLFPEAALEDGFDGKTSSRMK